MSNTIFEIGAHGLRPVENKTLPVGTVVTLNHTATEYGTERKWYVTGKSEHSHLLVRADGGKINSTPIIKEYGSSTAIGFYLDKDGEVVPVETVEKAQAIYKENSRKQAEASAEFKRVNEEKNSRLLDLLRPLVPANCVAFIVAELHVDDSDRMSDYFNYKTVRKVLLGWSTTDRNNFAEFRRAARNFPAVEFLADCEKEFEHRENYSGGAGYYLGKSKYDGWVIKKTYNDKLEHLVNYLASEADIADCIITPSEQTQIISEGKTITHNTEKNGVEIRFSGKPADEVLTNLKANGWRWSRFNKVWYNKFSEQAMEFANSI